jgi:hypothetical protein
MMTKSRWTTAAFLAIVPIATYSAGLPFIQDDFAKARAEARERKLPIFVDCWAPW